MQQVGYTEINNGRLHLLRMQMVADDFLKNCKIHNANNLYYKDKK